MCCCCSCCCDLFLVILAIFFPPLPVWIRRGVCSSELLILIALCILGYFPGLLYSWYIISEHRDNYVYVLEDEERRLYRNPQPIHVHITSPPPPQPQARAAPCEHEPLVGPSDQPPAYTEMPPAK